MRYCSVSPRFPWPPRPLPSPLTFPLVFLGGCASHVSPGGKAIESPIKEYFGQDPIERRAFGESENGAEAEDSPLRFRLTP